MTRSARYRTLAAVVFIAVAGRSIAADIAVKITPELDGITISHQGQPLRIERHQDQTHQINPRFQRIARKCPPFCIQPMQMPQGVETIAELEMLDYLQRAAAGDDSILIIDSRGPDWLNRGTIPGSVNIHYKRLSLRSSQETDIAAILTEQFGAERTEEFWNFRDAKTLVLFCNGAWCGQSPTNIRSLLRIGYPASKLKWYRGGMQGWEILGLTTVVPD
ncbi:MAG: rhodanese-like domain-containing protein [Sedimenticolaceae bacterium]